MKAKFDMCSDFVLVKKAILLKIMERLYNGYFLESEIFRLSKCLSLAELL